MRTNYCGELGKDFAGKSVTVCGWVHRRRDHGGVIFLDLRDTTGMVQIVVNPEQADSFTKADNVRSEYVLKVTGLVEERPQDSENLTLATGEIELRCEEIVVLNTAETPAFPLDQSSDVGEDVRLKNRTLDLRRPEMQNNLRLKSKLTKAIRDYLESESYMDIETPILTKATPEGARDYLVPSRTSPGNFFALPQSPQLFKQMLMVSGFDKYYQIARCFRDEDLRADRQPEFSQVDIEASFVDEADVMNMAESMIRFSFDKVLNIDLGNIPKIPWHESMNLYGCDKPDLRNPLILNEVSEVFLSEEFKVFSEPANDKNSRIAALVIDNGEEIGRGQIDRYTDFVKEFGAKGLAYIRVDEPTLARLNSPIIKYLSEECQQKLIESLNLKKGNLVFFGAGKMKVVNDYMSRLISRIGNDLGLVKEGFKSCWVTDFPMFEENSEGGLTALHHPFTSPKEQDPSKLKDSDSLEINSKAYDMVLNGVEIGGGSIRIHDSELQQEIFNILGLSKEEQNEKFGFFLRTLQSGCPPHGGIAFGLDRLAMLMVGAESIRDVIAFPKTQSALCLLSEAPGSVPDDSLEELHIKKIEE
ncbi:MAG: aspartate--tRNA ligase [SAR86 cluster bacterium]|jgi:aspartyl-tRNA synthetase|nr:aspartate--tRNA ligase [SAR86 cluster bacterium]MBL6810607.1 aspartate--tRNA ligase [SAR86 cluster bacterium]